MSVYDGQRQRGATMVEFVGAILVLLLLWAAVATVMEFLSEHNDEYTSMMASPFTRAVVAASSEESQR